MGRGQAEGASWSRGRTEESQTTYKRCGTSKDIQPIYVQDTCAWSLRGYNPDARNHRLVHYSDCMYPLSAYTPDISNCILMQLFKGELAHRQLKNFYQHTNKHDPMRQISKQERRLTRARRDIDANAVYFPEIEPEENETPRLSERYHLAHSSRHTVNLARFLEDHTGDPAIRVSTLY